MENLEILEDLNDEQREAVITTEGPLLVIAGAGTGKTTVITKRIAYLITTKNARPCEILALTFTDKAANEMMERVDILVPYGFNDVWISTFHSFGDRILREGGAELLGISPDFRILTFQESLVFFQENIFSLSDGIKKLLPSAEPTRHISSIISTISRAKDEDVTPEGYMEYVKKLETRSDVDSKEKTKQYEFALIYEKYEKLKLENKLLDFGDLISLPLKLFRENETVLEKYQEQYKYILVDEFQDTNYAQFELLKLLTGKNKNICVVADDDQSIYKFRGACMSNVIHFKNTYPQAKIIVLTKNYRSTQIILDSAYKLINHNNPDRLEVKYKVSKKLKSIKDSAGVPVRFNRFDTVDSESDFVARKIKEVVEKNEAKYKDIAILARTNDIANEFIRALNYYDIPWKFSGGRGLFARKEIRLLLDILKMINDPYDSEAIYNVAISDLYYIAPKTMAIIAHLSEKYNRPMYIIMRDLNSYELAEQEILNEEKEKIKIILKDIENYISKSKDTSAGVLLYSFLNEKGVIRTLASKNSIRDIECAVNMTRFFNIIDDFTKIKKRWDLNSLVRYLKKVSETTEEWQYEDYEFDIDAVNVLTIHKAKGLEFDIVFLVGLVEGRFPQQKRSEFIEFPKELIKDIAITKDYHIQEERRLFYVGLTRAKREVYLTSARDYRTKKAWKISRFVTETLDRPISDSTIEKVPWKSIISKFGTEEQTLPEIIIPEKLILSAYKIDDYLTCPLKYYYIHIMRIPLRRHHTIVFGNVIHKVICKYHKAKMKNRKFTIEDLKSCYEQYWESEGYLSREHEERRKKEGEEMLLNYYHLNESQGVKPLEVEGEFRFLFDRDVWITGRWDRLDRINGEHVITDYKTSDLDDKKSADERTKKSYQLLTYVLGHESKFGYIPTSLRLFFLGSNLIGEVKPTKENIQKLKVKIEETIKGIKDKKFDAKPDYFNCAYCPYANICQHTLSE